MAGTELASWFVAKAVEAYGDQVLADANPGLAEAQDVGRELARLIFVRAEADTGIPPPLAAAIVGFAREVGAIVVSEGIESQDELSCLVDLAVGCGQGFYLARPELGRVESRVPQPVA